MGPLPSIAQYSWTYDAAGRVDLFTAPEGVFDYGYTYQVTSAPLREKRISRRGTGRAEVRGEF